MIPLNEVISEAKSSSASVLKHSGTAGVDSDLEYYPTLSTKTDNPLYLSSNAGDDATTASVTAVPVSAATAAAMAAMANSNNKKPTSNDIYASLSMRSKSNGSVSSKLTEATAAVVAANRGSIKSSLKKNKKTAAAVAVAAMTAAAAANGSSKERNGKNGRESDYYQMVSTNNGVKPSLAVNSNKKVNINN